MWSFSNDRPVYVQIMDEIMIRIASGVYKSGERIPSVRELAEEARVNPNTMQKALYEIERMGYIISLRTSGKFVTEDVALIENYKNKHVEKIIACFFSEMKRIGVNRESAIENLRDYCTEEHID